MFQKDEVLIDIKDTVQWFSNINENDNFVQNDTLSLYKNLCYKKYKNFDESKDKIVLLKTQNT